VSGTPATYLREWRWERLKCAVQILAQPGEVQLKHLPNLVVKGDELALDFNNFHGACLPEMTPTQADALRPIDTLFERMSGRAGPWSDVDILQANEWESVRQMATSALQQFGWPNEVPPPNPDTFVPFPGQEATP
jgi:hypothetical protein